MNLDQKILRNGLNTLFVHSPGSTAASVQIWFRAGSALESQENQGIAHFLEHMFFKGTPKRPGALIAREVESFGGEINAFTSFDYTCYYINTPNTFVLHTIDILLDMVSNPMFLEEDLVPEREVVFEEYRRALDGPGQFAFFQIQKNCFNDGYAHPILGNEKTIKSFSRDQLMHFRNAFYNQSNVMLIVAGDLKHKDEITESIERYILPEGPKTEFTPFMLKKKSSVHVHHKDVRMAQLTMAIQGPLYFSNTTGSEDLAINCMGHGETSHLYRRIVHETTYANSISSSTMYFVNGGIHFIRFSAPTENLSKIYKEFMGIMRKLMQTGFIEADLHKIKNQYLASKIYEKESLESFSFSLGHGFAQSGDIHCENEFIENIRNSTLAETNFAFQDIFTRDVHFFLQLPKQESIEKQKKLLIGFQKEIATLKSPKNALSRPKKALFQCSSHDPEVKVFQIKKGIKLIHRRNKITPTFIMHTYIKGGLSQESTANNGVHHMLCSLLTKGHGKVSYAQIKKDLEEKSASLSGFAGKNSYGLTLHGKSEDSVLLLDHFFGSLLHPTIATSHYKHEKALLLRELEGQKEDPVRECFKQVNQLVFGDHPYHMNVLGTEESVARLSMKSLKDFHRLGIESKEMVFTYCGTADADKVLGLLEKKLSGLKARKEVKSIGDSKFTKFGEKIFVPFDREQSQIFIGMKGPRSASPEDTYLKMLTTHLSGQSSELFVEVRDRKGLCYSVQPIHMTALEGGYWGIYMAAGHDKTKKAIQAIEDILSKIRDNGLSNDDFLRVKKMSEGQNLLNVQTNDDYANIYSIPELYHLGLDNYYRINKLIQDTELKKFNDYIKSFLSQIPNTVVVGRSV